jgi:hypothetical protein
MTMLQIPLDEPIVDMLRRRAAAEGKSLEAWAADTIKRLAEPLDSGDWLDDYVATARQARGDSRGWKWNRDELYE